MLNKKFFVYLGYSGFPFGLAEVKKMTLISKSLVSQGHSVNIINKKGVHNKSTYPDLKVTGDFESIQYIYTSGDPFRNDRFIRRNFLKMKGIINEVSVLRRMKRKKELDYAILSTHNFSSIFYYYILSKLVGFRTILNHVEYFSDAKMKWPKLGKWMNDQLHDKYALLLVDISFPISEFLIDHIKKTAPHKHYLKIPILAEFEKFNNTEILQLPAYFFFSGAAAHLEIVKFIIDSFMQLNDSPASLYLAIKGEKIHLHEIEKYINSRANPKKIKLFTTLTEKQLYNYYRNATALLIPLRPTIQDKARFPHKIGEYLASGNPVISTNYGEVKYYFKDMDTMLIASKYDVNLFSDKMQYVLDHPFESRAVGAKGQEFALGNFDYRIYGAKIEKFLSQNNY